VGTKDPSRKENTQFWHINNSSDLPVLGARERAAAEVEDLAGEEVVEVFLTSQTALFATGVL
jgi:hypothetical protein